MDPAVSFEGTPSKRVKPDDTVQPTTELTSLHKHTSVVADTGDFTLIQRYSPEDSTTNPTLLLQIAKEPHGNAMLDESVKFALEHYRQYLEPQPVKREPRAKSKGKQPVQAEQPPKKSLAWNELSPEQKDALIDLAADHLSVSVGAKILQKISGLISTEVPAKLSFNRDETVARARRIIALYEGMGISASRVLIKIAATWQGIKAAEVLLKSKIQCNMTLIFHLTQALACGTSKLFLISPFVGRILDWHKNKTGKTFDDPSTDPGVISVGEIYNYYKKHGIKTIVMGASFRNTGEIKALCGCDKLTISPKLLDELSQKQGEVPVKLSAETAKTLDIPEHPMSEVIFRYQMNKSEMATDLLAAGIRKFEQDYEAIKKILLSKAEALFSSKTN